MSTSSMWPLPSGSNKRQPASTMSTAGLFAAALASPETRRPATVSASCSPRPLATAASLYSWPSFDAACTKLASSTCRAREANPRVSEQPDGYLCNISYSGYSGYCGYCGYCGYSVYSGYSGYRGAPSHRTPAALGGMRGDARALRPSAWA